MTMKCYNCGHEYFAHNGALAICDEYIGVFIVHNLSYMKCGQCGDKLYTPEAAKQIENSRNAALSAAILSRPIKSFISSSEAASILGISRQALHKHRRIRRGFIFQTRFDGKIVYLKESVLRFKQTGDGRFPLTDGTSEKPSYSHSITTGVRSNWGMILQNSLKERSRPTYFETPRIKERIYARFSE